jgi:cytochrome c biogenesis protein CcdA
MSAFLSYTLARLGLLALALGLGYVAGLRGPLLIVMAFLGSGIVSFFMLNKQRSHMGGKIAGYFQSINERIDANTRKEDVD